MSAVTYGASETWVAYRADPVLFVRDAFAAEPDQFQAEALRALAAGAHVAIRSGHGVGKTTTLAWALLWGLLVEGAVLPCTAPTEQQLRDVLWPEIGRWLARSPLLAGELEVTEKRIRLLRDEGVFAVTRVARTVEGLAGFHAARLIYLVDEAAGVSEQLMAVVDGALTTGGARCLMAGNPTKPTGYFVDAFGRNSERWRTFTVSGEDSVRVGRGWLAEMQQSWGRESDFYRVRVRGLPPQGEEYGFISFELVDQAIARAGEGHGCLVLGVDVARYGKDKSAVAVRRGHTVLQVLARHGLGNPQVAAWVMQLARDLARPGETPEIRVDDGGVGGGVTDLLHTAVMEGTLTADVQGLNFGGRGDRHYATNAGVWWNILRLLMQEQLLSLPDDPELAQQLTTRTFATNLHGKIVLETKDHMRSRGVPSPDKADAVALAFAGESLMDWSAAYSIRTCAGCAHKYPDPNKNRPCPRCGMPSPGAEELQVS